jgi:hypothetical protein
MLRSEHCLLRSAVTVQASIYHGPSNPFALVPVPCYPQGPGSCLDGFADAERYSIVEGVLSKSSRDLQIDHEQI